jgi:hypothetical protein
MLHGNEAEYYLLFIATFGGFCHAVQYLQGVPSGEIKTKKNNYCFHKSMILFKFHFSLTI